MRRPQQAHIEHLAATAFTADDPAIISAAYQQILAVLGSATAGIRAKDVCLALDIDIEPLPKHVEGARANLKRLVTREITEDPPGIFTLIGTVPGAVFSARHAGLRSGGMGTVSDDIERCESTEEDRW